MNVIAMSGRMRSIELQAPDGTAPRMRHMTLALGLAACIAATPARAQTPTTASHSLDTATIVAGLGAIAGVVAFNAGVLGIGALPGGAAYLGAATVPAEMAVAVSRVYAVGSAVAGAWLGDYLHDPAPNGAAGSDRLWAMGAGAIVGVAAFNSTTGPLGVLPWAGAALDPISVSTVLGSRLIAVGSAGLGAIGATWAYDKVTGSESDYAYMFTLLGGATGGVAIANYLSMGTVGVPPVAMGSNTGILYYGGAIASAATSAASRIWVEGSGVAGAAVADWL
jgi:hypothetical protein